MTKFSNTCVVAFVRKIDRFGGLVLRFVKSLRYKPQAAAEQFAVLGFEEFIDRPGRIYPYVIHTIFRVLPVRFTHQENIRVGQHPA